MYVAWGGALSAALGGFAYVTGVLMGAEEIDYLVEVRELHRLHVEPYKGKPKGCWDFEIRRLEKSFGFELPLAYKQYLKWMGKDYHGIFVGCD